jgi:hypothetical protein
MNHTGIHWEEKKKKRKPNVSIWKRSENPMLYEEIIKPKWIDGLEN